MTKRDDRQRTRRHTVGGEGGSATLWVLTACGLVLSAGLVAVLLSTAVLARHRAEAAADLAALAAADSAFRGRAAACASAARVAAAAEATLVTCTMTDATAAVVVRIALRGLLAGLPSVSASARAGPAPSGSGSGSGSVGLR